MRKGKGIQTYDQARFGCFFDLGIHFLQRP